MKRYMGNFIFVAGILVMATPAWGNHLDQEIEAVKQGIEETAMLMQRAQTLGVTGTGDLRGGISAEQSDLLALYKRLKELEERSQKEHAAQKK